MLNRWSGDNGNDAFTESLWCWESGEKQVVKWTAEGAVKCENERGMPRGDRGMTGNIFTEYSATCGHTSVAGDMLVSRREHARPLGLRWKQGGIADSLYSSLAESVFSAGDVLFWAPLAEKAEGAFPFLRRCRKWRFPQAWTRSSIPNSTAMLLTDESISFFYNEHFVMEKQYFHMPSL